MRCHWVVNVWHVPMSGRSIERPVALASVCHAVQGVLEHHGPPLQANPHPRRLIFLIILLFVVYVIARVNGA